MTNAPRIYADFNGLFRFSVEPEVLRVPLDAYGTLCSLAKARFTLTPGAQLVIFDPTDDLEDLEADATALFEEEQSRWVAEIDYKGYRYVPTHGVLAHPSLQCVRCGASLEEIIKMYGLAQRTACPVCGAKAQTPILPPRANDA